jgi:hypothetical protein
LSGRYLHEEGEEFAPSLVVSHHSASVSRQPVIITPE